MEGATEIDKPERTIIKLGRRDKKHLATMNNKTGKLNFIQITKSQPN